MAAATAVTGSCNTTIFLPSSLPKPSPSYKSFPLPRQLLHSHKITTPQISAPISAAMRPRSVSSTENGAVSEEQLADEERDGNGVSSSSPSPASLTIYPVKAGDAKGVEERRLKGAVMVKEGFKVGLRQSLGSDGGRLKLTVPVRHISNPVVAIDESAKAWMKSSPVGPANRYHYN